MTIIINGLCWVPKGFVTPELLIQFTYVNPFDEEPIVSYREHLNGFIGFPIGGLEIIKKFITEPIVLEDQRVSPKFKKKVTVKFGEPREYQTKAIEELKQVDRCIFTAPTSSGKSTSIAFLAQELGVKMLVVSHLTTLLQQIEEELNSFLTADIQRITSNTFILPDIALVTVQTLNRSPRLSKLCQKAFGVVYVDEFENLLSTNYVDALQRLHAKRLILTSATPSRDLVGLTPLVHHLATDVVNMVPTENAIVPVTVLSTQVELKASIPRDLRIRAKALQRFFPAVRPSVLQVANIILQNTEDIGIWIICNIKYEQEYYAQHLKGVVIASHIGKKKREEGLQQFKDGDVRVIIGSATMSAGISLPPIGFALRVCTHSSSSELFTQQIGRLRRKHPLKIRGLFIDFLYHGLMDSTRKSALRNLNTLDKTHRISYKTLVHTLKSKLTEFKEKSNGN